MPTRATTAQLVQKRKLFCMLYLALGNPAEAAVRAGFPRATAMLEALAILQMPYYQKLLTKLASQSATPMQTLVLAGLSRLAFGAANDAAKLVFADEMPPQAEIDALDLFHVSELKRVKGGGVEIKLFDRQKALEKLLECASSAEAATAASSLLEALRAPVAVAMGEDFDEEDAGDAAVFSQTAAGAELVAPAGNPSL